MDERTLRHYVERYRKEPGTESWLTTFYQGSQPKLSDEQMTLLDQHLSEHVYPQIKVVPFLGHNIKKLRDYDPPIWRYRIGKFRVFYFINTKEKIVYVLSVDQRKDAYK